MIRAALAAALIAFALPAAAQDLDFKVINQSSSGATTFNVSTINTDQWEENLFEGGVLPPGNEIDVLIADGESVCEYDIRFIFEDGSVLEERNLNLCELGSYTLHDE